MPRLSTEKALLLDHFRVFVTVHVNTLCLGPEKLPNILLRIVFCRECLGKLDNIFCGVKIVRIRFMCLNIPEDVCFEL